MLNKEKINKIPKKAGVYWFSFENKIVYVGSSKNLSKRMYYYNYYIKKGHNNNRQVDLVNYLKKHDVEINYILSENYSKLEQQKIQELKPIFNKQNVNSDLCNYKNQSEYHKLWRTKYRKHFLEYKSNYNNQLCNFNGEIKTLNALTLYFRRNGLKHPTKEAKKFLIKK